MVTFTFYMMWIMPMTSSVKLFTEKQLLVLCWILILTHFGPMLNVF